MTTIPTPEHFVRFIAGLTRDGECITHAGDCDGNHDDCEPFDLSGDDAISALCDLIATARTIRDAQP